MNYHVHRFFVVFVFVMVAASCGEPPETFDREEMLDDTASAIEQRHDTLETRASDLADAASTFCSDRTATNLETTRDGWLKLRASMRVIEAWAYTGSPYRDMDLERPLYKRDKPPANASNIDAVITGDDARYARDLRQDGDEMPDRVFPDGDDTLDDEFIRSQSYLRSAKGLPAVEYLLYDAGASASNADDVVSQYDTADNADRRCEYLELTIQDLEKAVNGYRQAWAPDGGNFAETFTSATDGSQTWPTVQDSINKMLSQLRFTTNTLMRQQRLGGPLGEYPMDAAIPQRVEAPYSQTSKQALLETLDGIALVYDHDQGSTLKDYANFRQSRVARRVTDYMSQARTAIQDVPAPLSTAISNDQQSVRDAMSELDELQRFIDTNLASTLGARTSNVVVDTD
jgi:predicted lipoprotein